MAIEVTAGSKKVFTFKGTEYPSLEEFKRAALTEALTYNGVPPEPEHVATILEHSDLVQEILRYAGRKSRKGKKAKAVEPEATA